MLRKHKCLNKLDKTLLYEERFIIVINKLEVKFWWVLNLVDLADF